MIEKNKDNDLNAFVENLVISAIGSKKAKEEISKVICSSIDEQDIVKGSEFDDIAATVDANDENIKSLNVKVQDLRQYIRNVEIDSVLQDDFDDLASDFDEVNENLQDVMPILRLLTKFVPFLKLIGLIKSENQPEKSNKLDDYPITSPYPTTQPNWVN